MAQSARRSLSAFWEVKKRQMPTVAVRHRKREARGRKRKANWMLPARRFRRPMRWRVFQGKRL